MNQLVPFVLTAGLQLYKYQLIGKIGQGNFGEVWLAADLAVGRQYAAKILKPGVGVDERLREAQIGNRLTHNNLVYVHQADVVDLPSGPAVLIAMDHLTNGCVASLANPAGFLPLPRVLKIVSDVLQGLDYLHARGMFHNDIKPGNILLGPQGQAMLSDYGITGVSQNGAPVPAPNAYILHRAPEVLATGNISISSDVFQLGMTMVRLLLGLNWLHDREQQLGQASFQAALNKGKLITQNDFSSYVPSPVRRVVLKAIHPDPAQRYQTALSMRRDVEKLSFPGWWTVDHDGSLVGRNGDFEYRFQQNPINPSTFEVACTRTNSRTGNTQRMTRFSRKAASPIEAKRVIDEFVQHVVTGK